MSDRAEIERALKNSGGKMGAAARALGISRRRLQSRMRAVGMPAGRAGRPKRKLAFKSSALNATVLATAAIVGGALAYGRFKRKPV